MPLPAFFCDFDSLSNLGVISLLSIQPIFVWDNTHYHKRLSTEETTAVVNPHYEKNGKIKVFFEAVGLIALQSVIKVFECIQVRISALNKVSTKERDL